jgi:nucleotide-binding universal stress UspA family protein
LLLGSVGERVAGGATCPVVVVRHAAATGPLVVGVDGSKASRAALRWAAEEARTWDVPVRAVLSWIDLMPGAGPGDPPLNVGHTHADALQALRTMVRYVLGPNPLVPLELAVSNEAPAKALVSAAAGARMLAVGLEGSRRRDHVDIGSVTWPVLLHAPCPVAIIKP